jgi:acyl-coenzyme A thioesterase PaaI-like protein
VTRITARLRASVPLEKGLTVAVDPSDSDYAVTVADGGAPLITGTVESARFDVLRRPGDKISRVPAGRSREIEAMARIAVPDRAPFFEEVGEHSVPGCFACGPEADRGLRIYPRVVADGVVCSAWRPDPEFRDDGGALSAPILTSALDCSSGICMPVAMQRELIEEDRFFVLGSLDVRYLRVAPLARDYRVVAKALHRDGRKFFGLAALFDNDGVPFAMTESTWVVAAVTRTEAFGARA